ncbi:MAG TPA: hypothetical protein VNS61_05615 [Caldimonas sp.]|nr:hypothetical protein [Caldimonas sp.]
MRTHLGYGSPEQVSLKAHGSPLGVADVKKTKDKLGWPSEPAFFVPKAALLLFREALTRGAAAETEWKRRIEDYARAFPKLASELQGRWRAELPDGWDVDIPVFPADAKGMATRAAGGGRVMNAIAPAAGALRRLGRPRSVDVHGAEGPRRFQSAAAARRRRRRIRRCRAEPCRTEPPLRG